MLAKVHSAATLGVEAYRVEVEVDFSGGLPGYQLVGLPNTAVQEGRFRIRAALLNAGFVLKAAKITINLAPADVRKDGAAFDLPIAIGMLAATEMVPSESLGERLFLGELSLDGTLRPIRGALPIATFAAAQGYKEIVVPSENAAEAVLVRGPVVRAARHLADVVRMLEGTAEIPAATEQATPVRSREAHPLLDYQDVRGQTLALRALEVAAAGAHNLLMVGPPGSGKTMLAQRLPTILPPLGREEALLSTTIYSVAGLLRGTGLLPARPFRSPHHTVTQAGLCGGGDQVRPGEVSLAHNGVLFLDELLEYSRPCLEALRQPIEDKRITIVRARRSVTYPAAFMLVAAMNPCPCGHLGNTLRSCRCSVERILRYRGRLSGPLLDRFDMHVWVPVTPYRTLQAQPEAEPSAAIADRVDAARAIQAQRFRDDKGIHANAQMTASLLRRFCKLSSGCHDLLAAYSQRTGCSTRSIERLIRVARTVADMAGRDPIAEDDLLSAMGTRYLDEQPMIELNQDFRESQPRSASTHGAERITYGEA